MVNDAYDFGIGRRLRNLKYLEEIGFATNRRLLDVQRVSHDVTEDGLRSAMCYHRVIRARCGRRCPSSSAHRRSTSAA